MNPEERIKEALQTLSSEACEWVEDGFDPQDKEYARQEACNRSMKRLGKMLVRHEAEILKLIANLEMNK